MYRTRLHSQKLFVFSELGSSMTSSSTGPLLGVNISESYFICESLIIFFLINFIMYIYITQLLYTIKLQRGNARSRVTSV